MINYSLLWYPNLHAADPARFYTWLRVARLWSEGLAW